MKQTNKKTWREKEGGKILQQQQLIIITNFPQIYRWIHDKYTPPASKKVSTECGAGFYGSEEKFKLFTDWSNVHYGSTSPFSPISTNHEQLTKLRRSHAPDTKNPQICVTPRRLSVRFDSVLLFLLKLLGPVWSSSSNSSTIVKCSEPSAWGFFLSQRLISFIRELNDVKERNLTKQPPLDFQSCDFFSRCNSFLNLFSFNYFDLWPDRWGSFEIFPTSLWMWLSSSSHCRSDRRLLK